MPRHMLRIAVLFLLVLFFLSSLPMIAEEQEPTHLKCLINMPWYETVGVSSFDGIIPEEIIKKTHVTLDIQIARDAQALSLLLAANDLPDIVFTEGQWERLSDPELCYDYDELIERYGIDWQIDDELRLNASSFSKDGRIYTVLNHYARPTDWRNLDAVPMTGTLCIRRDLLDEMGVESIPTLDRLKEVLLRAHEEYPDMITLGFNLNHRFKCLKCWFGIGDILFAEQADGSYLVYQKDARYREMLAFLNELYRNGCIAAENFASKTSILEDTYTSGRMFAYMGYTQNMNLRLDYSLKHVNPEWHSVELPPMEGACYDTSDIGWAGTFITRNCSDPEAAIRLIAWMFSEEGQRLTQWGREGEEYTLDASGRPVFSDQWIEASLNGDVEQTYNMWFYLGGSEILEAEGRCAVLDFDEYRDAYLGIRDLYGNKPWVTASTPLMGTEEYDIFNLLKNTCDQQEMTVIMAETPEAFEKAYEEYMHYLDYIKIDKLEDFMNRRIPIMEEKYKSVWSDPA